MKKRTKNTLYLIIIPVIFLTGMIFSYFLSKKYTQKENYNTNVVYFETEIEKYKDSILYLHEELQKDSIKTVVIFKYVNEKRKDFDTIVSKLEVEQTKKDTLVEIFTDIVDTLFSSIVEKDTLLKKQEEIIASLYNFSKEMGEEIAKNETEIQKLQQQLEKNRKKNSYKNWIIGGTVVISATVITTLILIR